MRVSARLLFPLSLAASIQAAHYEVTVGKGGQLKFDPEFLKVEIGDTIQYLFYAKVRHHFQVVNLGRGLTYIVAEPLDSPVELCRAVPTPEGWILLRICPFSIPRHPLADGIYRHSPGQESKMGLLQPG
jgi:hypothetical protein